MKVGDLLKEIRIKSGATLRTFCLERKLDPVRFSMIERNVLRPNDTEVNEYLNLKEAIKEVTLELTPLYQYHKVLHYCMTCGRTAVSSVYGLFEKKTGGLVNIVTGHEKPFVCKPCQKRIDMVGKKEKVIDQAKKEIERLAKFILEEYPNEPGKETSESAVDVAIRLLKKK